MNLWHKPTGNAKKWCTRRENRTNIILAQKSCKLLSFCNFNGEFPVSRGAKWGTVFACQKSDQTAWEQPNPHSQLLTVTIYSAIPKNQKKIRCFLMKKVFLSSEHEPLTERTYDPILHPVAEKRQLKFSLGRIRVLYSSKIS